MIKAMMDLQLFGEETATPITAADTGTAAENPAETANFNTGDTLPDGSQVDAQVAAALNRQMQRHPELRNVYRKGGRTAQARPTEAKPAAQQQVDPAAQPEGTGEPSIEERWEGLRKGEFKELYARDVQNAIRDRFKNQEDANNRLNAMQPMLNALMKKANVQTVEELQNIILDDDSLYEDEAEKMGMPVEAYKQFKKLQDEHDAAIKAQEQSAQDQMFRQHLAGLVQQGEELKKTFPNFNIYEELQNPTFRRLTSPSVGLKVEDAYFAIHRNELTPQLLGYGMQKARQQMSQTIQAQQARPAEGAMQAKVQAADVKLDPRTMSRKEREAIRRRVHAGEKVTFD